MVSLQDLLVPSDIFPAVRRFLLESGLQRTLGVFDSETGVGVYEEALAEQGEVLGLELTEACALWVVARRSCNQVTSVDAQTSVGSKVLCGVPAAAPKDPERARRKDRRPHSMSGTDIQRYERGSGELSPVLQQTGFTEPSADLAITDVSMATEASVACDNVAVPAEASAKTAKRLRKQARSGSAGQPYSRVNEEFWRDKVEDKRLLDNTHEAKAKYGAADGDAWATHAALDMSKVTGKGFRKEMAKKKRCTWRGNGALNQGVNSIAFSDTSDDG